MAEYYIRREGDDDASGPFDLDQLASLAELGKIDDTAYYYDMDSEEWRPITDSKEAMEALHPKKEKLSLKSQSTASPDEGETSAKSTDTAEKGDGEKDEPESAAEAEEEPKKSRPKLKRKKKEEEDSKPKPIVVEEMLAQAEGREGADPGSKSPMEKRATAAYLGLVTAMVLLLISAASMFLVEFDLVKTANAPLMMRSPYVIVAIADVILAVFLMLQVTDIYPLVRFKAALGFGFISILFISSGDPMMALGNALICAAIYFATATARLGAALVTIIVGLAGAALYAKQLIPLLTG